MLVSLAVEALPEVRLAVEEPHRNERKSEIGCALQVIAGEHPETTAVDRERLVKAELRG